MLGPGLTVVLLLASVDQAAPPGEAEARTGSDVSADTSTAGASPARPDRPEDSESSGGEEAAEGGGATRAIADPANRPRSCLEADLAEGPRRRGVQGRSFLKRNRFELSGLGGVYASDVVSSTWMAGGALAFFPHEDFGLEIMVTRSPVKFRLEEPFSGFDQDRRFIPGNAWQGMFGVLFAPLHAKLRTSEEHIVHGDLLFVAGAGRTEHASVQGLTWQAGVGFQLFLARFVALRVDLRDFVMAQEVLGRGRITHNVGVTAGIGVWSP